MTEVYIYSITVYSIGQYTWINFLYNINYVPTTLRNAPETVIIYTPNSGEARLTVGDTLMVRQ